MSTPLQGPYLMGLTPPFFPTAESVTNYGAIGDGLTDDTAAINNMLAYMTGNSAPASGGRNLKAPIFFPPGTYKISSDLVLQSAIQPVIMGYGATIKASGSAFTNSMLNLDGCYKGMVYGLTFIGDGTDQVNSAIKIDNSTAGFQNTTGVRIQDVIIRNLKYVSGIDASGTGSRQLDGVQFDNILIAGQQAAGAWSNSGNWQNGLLLGNGTFANNYNHNARGVSCSGHFVNYNVNVSSLSMNGGEPANGGTDFNILPNGPCTIECVQTQNCGQFFAVQGFSPTPVSFIDCLVKSNFINSPNGYVGTHIGGPLTLKNVSYAACQVAGSGVYGGCLIHVTNDGSASRYATLIAQNVCASGLKTATILPAAATGNANIVLENYMNYSPTTGNYTLTAGDILSYYTGTAWTTIA